MPRVVSSIKKAFSELNEVHRPDNGLLTTALEISTLECLAAELKTIKDGDNQYLERSKGVEYIEDDEILGNSDRMLFYSKELQSSAEDESTAHNPFVMGKLDMDSIKNVNFDDFQGYIDTMVENVANDDKDEAEAARKMKINKKNFGRFFPKLKEHCSLISIPSMLVLSCNIIEILRLRNTLIMTLEQAYILEELYERQMRVMGRDGRIYF